MKPELYISLDEKEFRELVNGKITELDMRSTRVFITLKDIGFDRMQDIVDHAALESLGQPDHEPN